MKSTLSSWREYAFSFCYQLHSSYKQIRFMHEIGPVHITANVRRFLDVTYSERWIGCGRSATWPAGSPHLKITRILFWGDLWNRSYASRLVLAPNISYRESLMQKIRSRRHQENLRENANHSFIAVNYAIPPPHRTAF